MNRAFYFTISSIGRKDVCATGCRHIDTERSRAAFLERNLSLIAERYNIDMAQAQVLQAKLFENPVISLEQNVYKPIEREVF